MSLIASHNLVSSPLHRQPAGDVSILVTNPPVGYRYFMPSQRLPSQLQGDPNRVTKAKRPVIEPNGQPLDRYHSPIHCQDVI